MARAAAREWRYGADYFRFFRFSPCRFFHMLMMPLTILLRPLPTAFAMLPSISPRRLLLPAAATLPLRHFGMPCRHFAEMPPAADVAFRLLIEAACPER